MKKVKAVIKRYGVLVLMLLVIIIIANICKKTSPLTLTRYQTYVEVDDKTRVAKWNLNKESIVNEEKIEVSSGFRTEILDGKGSWVFAITNDSEVNAQLEKETFLRIRLDNDSFTKDSSDRINWNFLSSSEGIIDNPITFKIDVYKTTLDQLLIYQYNDETLTYDDYMKLTEEEQKNYKQSINSIDQSLTVSLLELSSNLNTEFIKQSEIENSKTIFYYYFDIPFSSLTAMTDDYLDIDMNESLCFVVNWEVQANNSSKTDIDENDEYFAYKLVEGDIPDGYQLYNNLKYNIDGQSYAICYKSNSNQGLNFYEYTKYLCSLIGGEPGFIFPSDSGGQMRIYYRDLDSTQIAKIKQYSLSDNPSLEDLEHYVEQLEFSEYEKYLTDNQNQQAALGYLSYGLKLQIQYNLKIKQKKPE